MTSNASPSVVASGSTDAPAHGRIRGICGLQEPVVVIWVETVAGEALPVVFDQRGFHEVVAHRGAERLTGSAVTCRLRADLLGDGRSLSFDDEGVLQ